MVKNERVLAGLAGLYNLKERTYLVTWSDSAWSSTLTVVMTLANWSCLSCHRLWMKLF